MEKPQVAEQVKQNQPLRNWVKKIQLLGDRLGENQTHWG